jgi:heptosyltransferase II
VPAGAAARARRALGRDLRQARYDVVIDVYGKRESLLLVAACRAGRSIGYRKWYTGLFYSDPVERAPRARHGLPLAIEHRLALLAPLIGGSGIDGLATQPRLYVAAQEHEAARTFLAGHGIAGDRPPLMIGALGSSADKTYPLPAMARLLDRIAERVRAPLLFNCLPSQRAEVEALYRLCAAPTRAQIVADAYTAGLREFIAVLAQCRALVGNEGGAVNMARALDVPSFSIFSPWIGKEVWGSADDRRHPGVHLGDFAPERLAGRSSAALRRAAPALYREFRPDWIEPPLQRFLAELEAP